MKNKTVYALLCSTMISGCVAMVGGVRQDIAIESKVPDVQVSIGDQSCAPPCTVNVRRRWASYPMRATRGGQTIVEGPIYRRESANADPCWDHKVKVLMLPAIVDGLLIIPGIIDIATGITEFMPEEVTVEENRYLVNDPCFSKPHVGGYQRGFNGDGQE